MKTIYSGRTTAYKHKSIKWCVGYKGNILNENYPS